MDPETGKSAQVEIEAILISMIGNDMKIQTDEKSKPITLHKSGVSVRYTGDANKLGSFVTLRMSERKAINAGLV